MQGVSLGMDIQTSYMDIHTIHQKQFCSINIPGQKKNNHIDLSFLAANDYVFHNNSPSTFNPKFIPYTLIWGIKKQDIDPFFLHTFPEHFIFDNQHRCIGLQNLNQQILFYEAFQNYFKLLAKTIYQKTASPISSLNLHVPESQSHFLKSTFNQLLENSFSCKIKNHSSKNLILQQTTSSDFPLKQQVHVFANYAHPYLYYYNPKTSELHYHAFTQNLYRLDLAFLEKLKHQFIKSILPHNVSFNAHQRNHLFYAACHLRHGLTDHPSLRAFIPALCYSDEYGLHDFDFSIQRNDYEQFIQQNSANFLKEMDRFFLTHKILPHDINIVYLHGEGLYTPGLSSVLAHYFQKPKETIIQQPDYIIKQCTNF